MPQFPTYQSQGQVNVPREIAAPDDGRASALKATSNLVDTVQKIGQRLSDANDVMQETKKKTAIEIGLAQQEQAAAQDPNPDNVEMHLKALQDVVKNSPKIDNQEIAGRVDMEAEQAAFLSGIKINGIFQAKKMVQNSQTVTSLADVTAKNVAQAVTPVQAQQDTSNFLDEIHKQEMAGLLHPDAAKSAIKEFQVGVIKYKINSNNSTDPADYKGLTDGLDIKDSNEVQKMIGTRINQNKDAEVGNSMKYRTDIIKGVAAGDKTWNNPATLDKIASNDPALGSALQLVSDAQSKDKVDYEPTSKEGQEYADSVNKLLTGMTVKEVNDYLPTAIKQISKLPAAEMQSRLAILINAADDRAKNLPLRDQTDIPPEVIKQEGGLQAVIRWGKQHGDNDPQLINDYLEATHNGDSPSTAYNNAIKTKIMKDHPEVAAQKDVPNRVINNDSKSFHVFTGQTTIYPARIWNEKLGRFEINPNREESNDNSSKQKDK